MGCKNCNSMNVVIALYYDREGEIVSSESCHECGYEVKLSGGVIREPNK